MHRPSTVQRICSAFALCTVISSSALAQPAKPSTATPSKPSATPVAAAIAPTSKPSRAASKGCKWEAVSGAGLSAWVQRCDYGDRKITLFMKGNSLMQRYSDGGAPDSLIDVIDMLPAETPNATMSRVFALHTPTALRKKCVLAPYKDGGKPPAGTAFYSFEPNAAFAKELAKVDTKGDIPEPPCGELGVMPDGIQYFEVFTTSTVRKILLVRVGQDTPMFDERTLQLIDMPSPPPKTQP